MNITDPIADMLTRIRNAQVAKHDTVMIPASKTKKAIAKILYDEGYIRSYEFIDDGVQGQIKLAIKYIDEHKNPVIAGFAGFQNPVLGFMPNAKISPRYWGGWA